MSPGEVSSTLAGWTVVSLRPASQQAAVRDAVLARGAAFLALPALVLEALPVDARALDEAYACDAVIFTSPAAVEFAHAARALPMRVNAIAVGSGTARELAARGVHALQPADDAMRSEGVLALPALQPVDDAMRSEGVLVLPALQPPGTSAPRASDAVSTIAREARSGDATSTVAAPQASDTRARVALVTAPGGRNAIEPALRARGFDVSVIQVYRRLAPEFDAAQIAALDAIAGPRAVLLSSGEALANALAALPAHARSALLAATAVASSERLAAQARAAGFATTLAAASPRTESLLDALAAHAKGTAIR